MRFVAAAAVFFFHCQYQLFFASTTSQTNFDSIFSRSGYLGVGYFFILSGFVLTWSARSKDTVTAFWRRRFFKIYPNHLLTFAAAFLLLTYVANVTPGRKPALFNLFLIQAWSPNLAINNSVNNISWSLSCEALFYLSFPLLLWLIRKIRPERLWAWAIGIVVAIFAVPLVAQLLPSQPREVWPFASDTQFWFIYFFPPVRMLDFALGMLLARIVLAGRRVPLQLGGAIALAVAAYAVAPIFPGQYTLVAVTVLPLGLVIAAGAVADTHGHRTLLSTTTMVRLGEISFAFYMLHFMVLTYGHLWLGSGHYGTPLAIVVTMFLLLVTVLLAALLHGLWERPIMRRFSGPRRAVPANAPDRTAGAVPEPREPIEPRQPVAPEPAEPRVAVDAALKPGPSITVD